MRTDSERTARTSGSLPSRDLGERVQLYHCHYRTTVNACRYIPETCRMPFLHAPRPPGQRRLADAVILALARTDGFYNGASTFWLIVLLNDGAPLLKTVGGVLKNEVCTPRSGDCCVRYVAPQVTTPSEENYASLS